MKKKIAVLLAVVLVIGLVMAGVTRKDRAYAKTAQMHLEIPDSVKKEEEFQVQVVLDSDVNLYSVDAYITYNSEMMEFISEEENVTGSAGTLELKDVYGEETKNAEYTLTFRALDTGKADIALSQVYLIDYADMEYIEVVPSAKQFDIGVNHKEEADARLSELLVAPGDLTEAFQPDLMDYEMYVSADVEMVGVSAVAMDEDSVVSTDMPDTLKMGENIITITVTALSGNVNVYTIKVYREDTPETSQEEVTEQKLEKSGDQTSETEVEQSEEVTEQVLQQSEEVTEQEIQQESVINME
jgi:hypothetical protein